MESSSASNLGLYDIVQGILVSEKTMQASSSDDGMFVYVLKVSADATKPLIKKFFKSVLNEEAVSVQVLNVPAKKKSFKGRAGVRSGFKKAIVRVENAIELFTVTA